MFFHVRRSIPYFLFNSESASAYRSSFGSSAFLKFSAPRNRPLTSAPFGFTIRRSNDSTSFTWRSPTNNVKTEGIPFPFQSIFSMMPNARRETGCFANVVGHFHFVKYVDSAVTTKQLVELFLK